MTFRWLSRFQKFLVSVYYPFSKLHGVFKEIRANNLIPDQGDFQNIFALIKKPVHRYTILSTLPLKYTRMQKVINDLPTIGKSFIGFWLSSVFEILDPLLKSLLKLYTLSSSSPSFFPDVGL